MGHCIQQAVCRFKLAAMKKEPIAHTVILKDLEIGYHARKRSRQAVFGPVSAEISHAEMVGVIGRNGIGKSTLLRTLAGLQPALSGQIWIRDSEINSISLRDMARTVSYVSTEQVYGFQISVQELVRMGRYPYSGWFGKLAPGDETIIRQAIELTGISHLTGKSVHELSDGERQKAMISRALVQDTPIIILDEPTAFLDLPARYEILRILNDLTLNSNKTIVFSTHDLAMAMEVADKIWLLADNTIYQGAPEDLLINKVFRKLFLNSPAEFDPKTSSFRFSRIYNKQIALEGDNRFRLLTKRAMERIGFRVMDNGLLKVILSEQDGEPVWYLGSDESGIGFKSIYELIAHLKSHPYNLTT